MRESNGSLVGSRVRVSGLAARPELNGKMGIAEGFNPDTGRYVVQIDQSREIVALRAQNLTPYVANVNAQANYGGYNNASVRGEGIGGLDPRLIAVGILVCLVVVVKVPPLPAGLAVLVGFTLYTYGVAGLLQEMANGLTNLTGKVISANEAGALALVFAGLSYYYFVSRRSNYYDDDTYFDGYGYSSWGYGGGGFGGIDFYWYMAAAMLGSTAYRMGGGGGPNGWSLGQLGHSLSNMDIWRGMMLMNLIQQVMGGRRRGMGGMGMRRGMGMGGFGRRRFY